MKVLFVTSQVITRHATMKRAAGMAEPLVRMGWKVGVLAEDHPDNRDYFGAIAGIETMYYPPGTVAEERAWKNREVANGSWELVHVCGLGWRNAIRRHRRMMVVMDHVELESSLRGTPWLRRMAQKCLEDWSKRYYPGAIGASKWLYSWLCPSARRRVQYLPYGAESVGPEAGAQAASFAAARNLGRYALYCGGMYRNYGFWTMLDAFVAVARLEPDFNAVLLGRGPEKDLGMRRIAEAGLGERIRFPGFVPEEELKHYLYGAEVHVSPLSDTLTDKARCPSKIPMYMQTRRPIVTCRIGEAEAYLGESGFYYTPGRSESLAAALADVWTRCPGPAAYDVDRFSWPSLARRYAEFWTAGLLKAGSR